MSDTAPEEPQRPPSPPQPMPYIPPPPGFVSDKKGKPIQLIVAWTLTVVSLGYMLPWAIAATRGKSNAGMIGILTFLVGWTLIGWIVALVMACGAHAKAYFEGR